MEGNGMSKAEIDTTTPFRSVKEAVMLFGDRVLATEVYATSLKQMQNGTMIEDYEKEVARFEEVEEAKQRLRRAREESVQLATSLFFLKQELEQTKTELHQLKLHDYAPNGQVEFQKKKYVTFMDPPCVERVVRPDAQASVESVDLRRQASLRKKKMKQLMLIPLIKRIFLRKRGNSELAFA